MNSQNNGFKIGSIVVFLGLTIYYLFPTIQWQLEQRHMENMVPSERVQYQEENAAKLQNLREESLSLGLDLQGGMYVTLEVGTPQLLLELAGEYADEELEEIIQVARDRSFEQRT
ncbi:MAG: protein translocase subunit SecD, partial [Bacteroidetes bacterium]|nr:protein translocase subunit SecD [Bacteroidota bacterium]